MNDPAQVSADCALIMASQTDPWLTWCNYNSFLTIDSWETQGGGAHTYAIWGRAVDSIKTVGWAQIAEPEGASPSLVYFGNFFIYIYGDLPTFDANGYSANIPANFYVEHVFGNDAAGWGDWSTPVNITQTVTGLVVGQVSARRLCPMRAWLFVCHSLSSLFIREPRLLL